MAFIYSLYFNLFFAWMWVCSHEFMHTTCTPGACRGQTGKLTSLNLVLQTVVSQRNGLSLSFHRPLSVVYCSIGHWNISCMFGMIWLLFSILHSEIKHLVTAFVVVYLSGSKFTDYREFVATRQSLVTPQFWKVCTYSIISDVNVKINSVIFWFLIDYWVWRCYRHFNIEFGYCFRSGS